MMIFRVFSLLCSGTHDGQVQKMLQYTQFRRIYQRCVCHCSSLKSAMLKQCRVQIQIQTHIEFVDQHEYSFQSLNSCCFQYIYFIGVAGTLCKCGNESSKV